MFACTGISWSPCRVHPAQASHGVEDICATVRLRVSYLCRRHATIHIQHFPLPSLNEQVLGISL